MFLIILQYHTLIIPRQFLNILQYILIYFCYLRNGSLEKYFESLALIQMYLSQDQRYSNLIQIISNSEHPFPKSIFHSIFCIAV